MHIGPQQCVFIFIFIEMLVTLPFHFLFSLFYFNLRGIREKGMLQRIMYLGREGGAKTCLNAKTRQNVPEFLLTELSSNCIFSLDYFVLADNFNSVYNNVILGLLYFPYRLKFWRKKRTGLTLKYNFCMRNLNG